MLAEFNNFNDCNNELGLFFSYENYDDCIHAIQQTLPNDELINNYFAENWRI